MNILLLGKKENYNLMKSVNKQIKQSNPNTLLYLPHDIIKSFKDFSFPIEKISEDSRELFTNVNFLYENYTLKYIEGLLKNKGKGSIDAVILCNEKHHDINDLEFQQLKLAIYNYNKPTFLLNSPPSDNKDVGSLWCSNLLTLFDEDAIKEKPKAKHLKYYKTHL